jgi:hypothetical protein
VVAGDGPSEKRQSSGKRRRQTRAAVGECH